MVLSCIKNSWQYWRTLRDSFLSQHIIFRYCNIKKPKTSNHKKCMQMKNIWLVCRQLQYSVNLYSFQLLLWSLFAFLKVALWFHFSENGPFANTNTIWTSSTVYILVTRDSVYHSYHVFFKWSKCKQAQTSHEKEAEACVLT